MLRSLTNLTKLSSLTKTLSGAESILDSVKIPVSYLNITSQYSSKPSHKRDYLVKSKDDDGTEGERTVTIDQFKNRSEMFPDKNTPSLVFDGILFSELPICAIKTSQNNTLFALTEHTGVIKASHSCGKEGYKNTKKGTNIAAQQSALTFGSKILKSGIRTIRVVIRGLGPGRASSIKGLEMSGLNIVSITDNTRVSWTPPRPRKVRRV